MWVAHRTYGVGDYLVGVRTNSMVFAEWLDEALGRYQEEEETEGYLSVIIGDPDRNPRLGKQYHQLYAEGNSILRTFDASALARTLFHELETFLRPLMSDVIYADLAVVQADGVTGLIPADLLPYLGELGRTVANAGLVLPRSRQTAIDPATGQVLPLPALLDVPQSALGDLAEITPAAGGDPRLVVDRPIKVDVVCSIGQRDAPVTPVPPGQMLYQLARQTRNMRKVGAAGIEGLSKLVLGARDVEVQSRNARQTLQCLLAALRAA